MPGCNPPTSMRRGKGFTKAETTTLLRTIEQVLPINAEHGLKSMTSSTVNTPLKVLKV